MRFNLQSLKKSCYKFPGDKACSHKLKFNQFRDSILLVFYFFVWCVPYKRSIDQLRNIIFLIIFPKKWYLLPLVDFIILDSASMFFIAFSYIIEIWSFQVDFDSCVIARFIAFITLLTMCISLGFSHTLQSIFFFFVIWMYWNLARPNSDQQLTLKLHRLDYTLLPTFYHGFIRIFF